MLSFTGASFFDLVKAPKLRSVSPQVQGFVGRLTRTSIDHNDGCDDDDEEEEEEERGTLRGGGN